MRTQRAVVATEILGQSTVGTRSTATLVRIQIDFVVDVALDEVRDRCVVDACMKNKN